MLPDNDALVQVIKLRPEILQQMLQVITNNQPFRHNCDSCKTSQIMISEQLIVILLINLLQTVLNIIMFEDCRNQWSMSRPLLGLILLNEDYFQQLRDQVSIFIDKNLGSSLVWGGGDNFSYFKTVFTIMCIEA